MTIREAAAVDGPVLADFFLETPVRAGTEFVLDRRPDFQALLRLRGESRTFVAVDDARVVGTITALWHDVDDGGRSLRIGEIADLRIAPSARGGPAAARLIGSLRAVFADAGVDWVTALIGEHNAAAAGLVGGRAGLPRLTRIARYASAHLPAFAVPRRAAIDGVTVRSARPDDAPALAAFVARVTTPRPFAPSTAFPWPDPSGQHRVWVAERRDRRLIGALAVWDGASVRAIRIVRYSAADQVLRAVTALAGLAGLAVPLPAPGGTLGTWASRWCGVEGGATDVAGMLVGQALRDAAGARRHVVQMNHAEDDPLRAALRWLPHSVYWTGVFAAPLTDRGRAMRLDGRAMCFADLALV